MSFLRGDTDINAAVRKATSPDETAPKRKHVRACVVYTWDHRNGREFWNAVKLLPIQNDDVQCFKALIMIHKVIQEGHKSVLQEAIKNVNWIRSLAKGGYANGGYSRLIDEYVRLLLHKLEFHRAHAAFNGTFEYEEYISLRSVDDPNEGYESIIDLMNLQDSIDDFQRMVFSSLKGRYGNECRISSLTAMVTEAYGIYRFITSMLRVMHQTTDDSEVLEPLRQRYYSQHRRLRNFFFDCTTLKPLTSLITIPELAEEPPNLFVDVEGAPPLPKRPIERSKTGESSAPPGSLAPEPTGDWYLQQQQQQQQQAYEDQQRQLQAQQEAELMRQQQAALEQQRQFDAQQAALLAQQQQAQEEFLRSQNQRHTDGRVAELEQQLFAIQNQQEEAQMMLQQYDQRVQTLETELAQANSFSQQQADARAEQMDSLQEQVQTWKSKYESLAKLYSQLRQEHLDLLAKFKKVQTKAASAQEALDKRERLERDLKSKNLELADLIRERDRARYELDRTRGQHKDETDRLERDLSLLNDKLASTSLTGTERAHLLAAHSKELSELEGKLKGSHQDKDDEIMYLKETVAAMEEELGQSAAAAASASSGGHADNLVDAVLKSSAEAVQEALFLFESPAHAGNQSSTLPYTASNVDKAWDSVDAFSNAFTDAIAEGAGADQSPIIKTCITLTATIAELLGNAKGLNQLQQNEDMFDNIAVPAQAAAAAVYTFYTSMTSEILSSLDVDDRIELVVANHTDVQAALQQLSRALTAIMPKAAHDDDPDTAMARAAEAAELANRRLTELLARPRDPSLSKFDHQVNEAIIAAAVAVTSAITALIKAATEVQKEIVARGRGTDSTKAFYKKNHRWTQGLVTAAYAVADATNVLITTADGSLAGKNSPEQLIVASNEVSASTAQLVAAARVKADYMSKTQERLESASKSVTSACRSLVSRVQDILAKRDAGTSKQVDYAQLSDHEFKSAAMEQQVEVLKLERELNAARNRLFAIRREEYSRQDED